MYEDKIAPGAFLGCFCLDLQHELGCHVSGLALPTFTQLMVHQSEALSKEHNTTDANSTLYTDEIRNVHSLVSP